MDNRIIIGLIINSGSSEINGKFEALIIDILILLLDNKKEITPIKMRSEGFIRKL